MRGNEKDALVCLNFHLYQGKSLGETQSALLVGSADRLYGEIAAVAGASNFLIASAASLSPSGV
jgi:hypothetical protein